MGSVLQFTAILCICCLIRGAVTHSSQDEDKKMNNKHSNKNNPNMGDFYFDEQKSNYDNVKTGRAISQSSWSKKDKEETEPIENKTGTQFKDELSFKNALSYLLNLINELKKDIFDLKETAPIEHAMDSRNSQNKSDDKGKQNNREETNAPKSYASNESDRKNQLPKSNYIKEYYQNDDIKFVDNDLENSSDESDDSSHKINESVNMNEVDENKENKCNSKCMKNKRNPDKYSAEAEETRTFATIQTKIPDESDKEFDDSKDDAKVDIFKEFTTKFSKTEQDNSKASKEKTKNMTTITSTSKTRKCRKKNDKNYNNLNGRSEPKEKPLNPNEYVTTKKPQNENLDNTKFKRSDRNKTTDNFLKLTSQSSDSESPAKNSRDKSDLDFNSKSGILGQTTTLSSQSSNDGAYSKNTENENELYSFGISSKKQEQIPSPKPEYHKQVQNKEKTFKHIDRTNGHTTISMLSHKTGGEPNYKLITNAEVTESPKESKGERLNDIPTHTTKTYAGNKPNSKTNRQLTSKDFDTGNVISSTASEDMNADNSNSDLSDNLRDNKGINKSEESESSIGAKRDKNYSETQKDRETEQINLQELNDDFESEISIENNKFSYLNIEDNDDDLASMTTNDLLSVQDSNRDTQNHDVEVSNNQQGQKNNEKLNKKDKISEVSPDQKDEDKEDNEDSDISNELTDMQDFNQNQESKFITNNENEESSDEINTDNTETARKLKEKGISQNTEYLMEEKSREQYDTFLEYFYKHSNNSLFQSLKNQ